MNNWENTLDFLARYIADKNTMIDYLQKQLAELRSENDRLMARLRRPGGTAPQAEEAMRQDVC